MSKPKSRIFQVISSRVSGTTTARKLSSAVPTASALTREAAQSVAENKK